MRKEVYKLYIKIDKLNGEYEINQDGAIRNSTTKRLIQTFLSAEGAVVCNLKKKRLRVARLVAEAFIPNPHNKPIIGYKDGDKENVNADNLVWCTYAEHIALAIQTGYQKEHANKTAIAQLDKGKTRIIAGYTSLLEASKATGVPIGNISEVLNGKRKTAGGFVWKRIKRKKENE